MQATEKSVLLSLADDDFHRALAGPGAGARGESSHILGLQSLRSPGDLVWPARDTSRAVTIPAGAAIEDPAAASIYSQRLPLLSYLPTSAVARIASASSIERRHPGETILAEGAPPGDAYIIWEGHVQISQRGRPRRVAGAGELIGAIATLHGGTLTEAAVALDDAILLTLPRKELLAELTAGLDAHDEAESVPATSEESG